MQAQVENITHAGSLYAIIIRREYSDPGIKFFTDDENCFQIGAMIHSRGTQIQPHVHNSVERKVVHTQEALFIRRGTLRVDFYTAEKKVFRSEILRALDCILLIDGAHGFEAMDDLEMIEVKQGPFVGNKDKTRFEG